MKSTNRYNPHLVRSLGLKPWLVDAGISKFQLLNLRREFLHGIWNIRQNHAYAQETIANRLNLAKIWLIGKEFSKLDRSSWLNTNDQALKRMINEKIYLRQWSRFLSKLQVESLTVGLCNQFSALLNRILRSSSAKIGRLTLNIVFKVLTAQSMFPPFLNAKL